MKLEGELVTNLGRAVLVHLSALGIAGCLFSPSNIFGRPGDTLTDSEQRQLQELAKQVAACNPVQGFPFIPCVKGDPQAAVPGLISKIRVVRVNEQFKCNSVTAIGCWKQSTMTLTYDISGNTYPAEGILTYELTHALLYAIDDWRKSCVLHDSNHNGVFDCYE